jgi:hypothetical protein
MAASRVTGIHTYEAEIKIADAIRMLCDDLQRESPKPSPDLPFGLCSYVSLHNIRYGI